jgi:DNA polymerase elongation subunit (family B)
LYQSVYYDFKTYTYYLRDDKSPEFQQFKYTPTYWKRIDEWQEDAQPILTGGWALPTQKLNKEDPNLLEKDINKELVILRDLYYEFDNIVPSFHNIIYLDIEIEMGGALTPEYIKSAPMPFTSIALIDATTKNKICFIVDKSKEIQEINKDGKQIIPCLSEKDLIKKFLDKWEELDPTIVVGWNSEYFDIPYLYFRFQKILGDEVLRLSPIKKIKINEYLGENQINIGGINHLDYMLLFKKYITDQEPSYKLGDIGEKYVKLGKIEFEGNLNQLFKNDLNKFIDYNLRDVEIIEQLEEKLKFIVLTISLCHICNIPYNQVYYNTVMNEGAILKYLKREGIVSPNKPTTHNPQLRNFKQTYSGGYLKDPTPGLYHNVIDLDFTSLYKSIIETLNIGIDTILGQIKINNVEPYYQQDLSFDKLQKLDPKTKIEFLKLDKKNYQLKYTDTNVGKILDIIKKNNYRISPSGAIFSNEKGVVSKILEGWSEKREYYRELKKKAGKEKDWKKYNEYDILQRNFKTLLVAMYGTFAISSWRYSDGHLLCSSAITNSGQMLTKLTIEFVNKFYSEKYGDKDYISHSDTDSLFLKLEDIVNKKYSNIKDKKLKNEKILEEAYIIQTESNNNLNKISKQLFNCDSHGFQLKQEVIIQSLLTTGKRRYAMYITNNEGVEVEELIIKGLELKKSNMNKIFKQFGEQFIKNILFDKSKQEIDNDIIDFYKSLKTLDPKTLGKPTGVKQIHNYHIPAKAGDIFSNFRIKAPSNTKAAVRYNDLLKFKKLDKKYESIIEGDKIFIINLKKNPFNLETIGLPNSLPPPEIEEFVKTYIDIDEIFNSLLLNKLKSLYNDLSWDFPPLNSNVSKFFQFN